MRLGQSEEKPRKYRRQAYSGRTSKDNLVPLQDLGLARIQEALKDTPHVYDEPLKRKVPFHYHRCYKCRSMHDRKCSEKGCEEQYDKTCERHS